MNSIKLNFSELNNFGKKIKWTDSVGKKIYFNFNGIDSYFTIYDLKFEDGRRKLLIGNEQYKKWTDSSSIINNKINRILKYITQGKFFYKVGQIVNNFEILENTINEENEIHFKKCKVKCLKCEKIFYKREYDIANSGCPYCSGRIVTENFNDLWTLRPDLRKYFVYEEEAKKVTICSNKKIKVKCPICGEEKYMNIGHLTERGFSCPKCSDGISYSEKFLYNLLKNVNVVFKKEKTFDWSQNKRYDFYIPKLSCIIEVHGLQHYFYTGFSRSLEEEQENDKLKEQLAKENGIKHYIILDCRKSEMEWVKNSILNSQLNELFDLSNINWKEIDYNSNSSLFIKFYILFKEKIPLNKIIEQLEIHETTAYKYLRKINKMDKGYE